VDVKGYHLDIKVNPVDSTITGSNTKYKVVQPYNVMQIDLQNRCQLPRLQDGVV
jgi:hypothetical protein